MLYAYIGTAAVIAILVGSITLCVIWLSRKISTGIREKTVDILSTYDVLLEKRSRELALLEEAILQKSGSAAESSAQVSAAASSTGADASVVNIAERLASVSYRESAVSQTYRKIRDTFHYDRRLVLAGFPEELLVVQPGPATTLLADLPYDTVFRLSVLDSADQLSVLEETLSGESLRLLKEFCGKHATFRIIEFYDYLQAMASLEPQRPRFRVSPGYRGDVPDGLELFVDPDICEGFQIEVAGSIYDYCVKGRELS